ncbi:hypothetical protein ABI582_19200 [Pseudomonas sp. SAS7]|uniref:hypothetical protein n=1 Tax=Pseudomonas sp. SAS7 TaxID=3156487 RepID=UPI003F94714E
MSIDCIPKIENTATSAKPTPLPNAYVFGYYQGDFGRWHPCRGQQGLKRAGHDGDGKVFVTSRNELQGQFNAPDGARMLWRTVDISRCEYLFLLEGMGIEDGCIGPVAHYVTDVPTVQKMRSAELGNFLSVSKIHLITPPEKNQHGSYVMELLSEIRILGDTGARPVYEFVTNDGRIYSSDRP